MLVGYARVSTTDQSLNLQKDSLEKNGCEKIYHDVASGVADSRPGLEELMKYIREGDTLVVWKLDRLGRSLRNLIDTINDLHKKGIGFKSIRESIDTTTSGGKLVFHIFASLAEFERELITERTQAGLKAARARGRLGGRPTKLDKKGVETARKLMKDTNISINEICKMLKISRSTLYRNVNKTKT
ncbi:MAG TPA: recombinase family protein [Victivallales bacterium]|nr:recombinase family protein [Victivallales bacterium]|tara:strand:+ start:1441 stop:1998 length:558 start_codon:yes stop_codon:yes gene_type:complete